MKKFFFSLLAICVCHTSQSKTFIDPSEPPKKPTYSNLRFSNIQDYWFVSLSSGAAIYFGDHDKQLEIEERFSPKFEIFAAKRFNDSFGLRLNIEGIEYKGLTQNRSLSTGKIFDPKQRLLHQRLKYVSTNADLLINVSNDLRGYNYKRTYNFIPFASIGLIVGLDHAKATRLSPGMGILQTFRLNDHLDIHLDLRGNIHGDGFDGEYGGRDFDVTLAALLGINLKLW